MNKLNKIRLPLDITMTVLSIILMGGNFLFPADIVHEILGTGLFVLWGVHIFLNRRWYASLAQASKSITSTNANDRRAYGAIFKGKYNPYRIMQTVINCCILICTIILMISGIILSNQFFHIHNRRNEIRFFNQTVKIRIHAEKCSDTIGNQNNTFYFFFKTGDRIVYFLPRFPGRKSLVIQTNHFAIWKEIFIMSAFRSVSALSVDV